MEKWLSIEMDILCMCVLILLLYNLKKQGNYFLEGKIFSYLILSIIGLQVDDIIWLLVDHNPHILARSINVISTVLYFMIVGVMCLLWVMYVNYKVHHDIERLKKELRWCVLPCAILCILSICSLWTKWLYYIDESGTYRRGEYHFIMRIVIYLYLLHAAIYSLYYAKYKATSYQGKEHRMLAYVTVFPLVGSMIQVFLYGEIAIVSVFIIISVLMVYINSQNKQISTDGLTGINNRGQLNKYLEIQMNCRTENEKLYLVLIDLDLFKKINDTYGHIEGDKALINVAKILKEVCSKGNDFLARYGGDEFVIVCKRKCIEEIEALKEQIQRAVQHANESKKTKYTISLSIGHAIYNGKTMSSPEAFINAADRILYEVKEAKRKKYNRVL